MDTWTKDKRSEVMSKIPTKGTRPEIAFRKALFARGFRYRLNDKKLPGKPDVVLPRYNTVIFVHGCFWHGHDGCKNARIPKSNVEFWEDKILCNRERDKSNLAKLEKLGWNVLTVWECEVSKRRLNNTVNNVVEALLRKSAPAS